MGLWTQIYTSSQRFNGSSRPGTRPRSVHVDSQPVPSEPARFVCPSCVDPIPPGVTCDRCDVESIDRFSRRRSHRLGMFPSFWLRELARTIRGSFESVPLVPIGSARGWSRVRGTIVSVRESVDGKVAWMRLSSRDVISDVGSFVVRDDSGTLSVGVHVHDVKVLPTKRGWDLEVGDEVELVGVVTPAGDGAYRTGHATLSAPLWEPALLRPAVSAT